MSNIGNSDDEFDNENYNWNDEAAEPEQKKEGQDSEEEFEFDLDDMIANRYQEELNKTVILIHRVG